MNSNRKLVKQLYDDLQPSGRQMIDITVDRIVEAKKNTSREIVQ